MKNLKLSLMFLFLTLGLIFLFFYPTLFYKVKAYDELIPFKEVLLPSCFSLSEIFELISLLGLHNHFEATNTMYSNIVSLRCNPLGNLLQMLIQCFFKKNPFNYHLYSLVLHLINTVILFQLITRASNIFKSTNSNQSQNFYRLLLISLLTIFWSTHPANIESVLLLTNANIVLSYTFCLLATYLYLSAIPNDFKLVKLSLPRSSVIFILYLLGLFTAEFHFLLPFILISYTTAINYFFNKKSLLSSFKQSLLSAMPFVLGVIIFIISFLFSHTSKNISIQSNLSLILERILWLAPQIIFHLIKLVFLPIKLSIDQSLLVNLGRSYFDPYSIFCVLFIFLLVTLAMISLSKAKKTFPSFFIFFFLFLLSLVPFSQMLAPLYNLCSERYLYLPTLVLTFGISHWLFQVTNNNKTFAKAVILVFIIIAPYTIRAYFRTLDWRDSFTLYYSAAKATDNPLYKAFRLKGLTPQNKIFSKYIEREVEPKYIKLAYLNLKKAIKILSKETQEYDSSTPNILKVYGLNPASLLSKAACTLSQVDFTLNNNLKRALTIIAPYTSNLNLFSIANLSFYGSLLFYNNQLNEAENVLRFAHKKDPYATYIIFPLCDLIQQKYGTLDEVEKLTLHAFKYYPYDTFTLLVMKKIYELKRDYDKLAYFSYVYGLRHHSIDDLKTSYSLFTLTNKKDWAKKSLNKIRFLEKKLKIT